MRLAGLFIGPLVSGKEPKGQRLGVNVLFGALLLVVFGSLTGEWLSIQNKLTDAVSFYWGHQGYEYVDLGRVWQIGLMVGLSVLGVAGTRGIRLPGAARHMEMASGLLIMILGLLVLWLE